MKPTVITANQTGGGGGNGNGNGAAPGSAGINIPVNRDYVGISSSPQQHQPLPHPHAQHYAQQSPSQFYSNYGSPRQQHQQHQQPQQQVPPTNPQQQHFQPPFGFEPDMDMDMDNMFPRSRLGRLHNDHFAGFGGARKRNSLHDPHTQTQTHPTAHSMHPDEDFSHYFDDAADFGFPQFSTLGRRGRVAGGANSHIEPDDDFFNRLPSEFRQYIPETFVPRRTAGGVPQPQVRPQQQYYQQAPAQPPQQPQAQVPQSPSKRLCDAAIQTEDPIGGRSEVDCAPPANLNQHGLRNTMDMGVKSAAEQEQALRSHSAPPPEQQQLNQQYQQQQQQQPQPHQQQQYGTQTTPPVQANYGPGAQQTPTPLQFHKTYYAPHQQPHPQQQHQQKQQTPPPPQTPGGSNIRTIPIFVEGRTEPIINAHKEIPNQSQAQASASAQAYYAPPPPQQQPQQQQHQQPQRPGPLNTQQAQAEQQMDAGAGIPPQTPHTVDSIKKIQDIQRDVLELMAKVEQFKGTRQDKEYAYLDEMLTRNLLKLDTIDTNGKDSIRLARKEAIKCIQASVNVLDAKAEENGRIAAAAGTEAIAVAATEPAEPSLADEAESAAVAEPATPQPLDATKIQEPIPLPPPPSAAVPATTAASAADNATELQAGTETTTTLTTQSSE